MTRGSDETIASRKHDRVESAVEMARARRDGVEDSHIRAQRVTPTGSRKREMATEYFRA